MTEKFTRFALGEDGVVREDRRDWLGDQPAVGFGAIAAASGRAWTDHPEALARTCRLPFGEFDGETAAGINLFDAVVHGWDITVALRLPWQPDERATEVSLHVADLLVTPAARGGGQFGSPRTTGATPRDRLLALTGRA